MNKIFKKALIFDEINGITFNFTQLNNKIEQFKKLNQKFVGTPYSWICQSAYEYFAIYFVVIGS